MDQPKPGRGNPMEEDDALFQRVWKRVTGESDAETPALVPAPSAEQTPAPSAAPSAAPPSRTDTDTYIQRQQKALCRLIDGELATRRTCRALSGSRVPALERIAAADLSRAKRLSAALFLYYGIRYFPCRAVSAARSESLWEGVRTLFETKQDLRRQFQEAASFTKEPSLRELYEEIAFEEETQLIRLRRLIEDGLAAEAR